MRALARVLPSLVLALSVAGCTGDIDPLGEAIEVRDLGLAGLSIVRPADVQRPITINPDERLRFTLEGTNANGGRIEVSERGRAWRVSDSNVATIDGNGELVGRADGDVRVAVRIGDVVASEVDVIVSRSSVAAIDRVAGSDLIDPCVVERYVAIGDFADGSERLLSDVRWSTTAAAELSVGDDGSVELSSGTPGPLELVASVNEASLVKPLRVDDSLRSLAIGPSTLAAEVGSTLDLRATATFGGADGVERTGTVTSSVDWSVAEGAQFATVDNEPGSRGRVSASVAGIANVRAACGPVTDVRAFTVFEGRSGNGGSSDVRALSFEDAVNAGDGSDGGDLEVSLARRSVQLRVSTGSSYDEDDDVTSDATWSLVNAADSVVGTVGASGNFIMNTTGIVQVRAELGSDVAVLTLTIN